VDSVLAHLGVDVFWHVRMGVDARADREIPGEKYVLTRFSAEEQQLLQKQHVLLWQSLEKRLEEGVPPESGNFESKTSGSKNSESKNGDTPNV
jgi:peptidyl-tRNA hydrolase